MSVDKSLMCVNAPWRQVDLSQCTKWHRLVDIHYHRPEEVVGDKQFPEQEEVTVIFLCDLREAQQVCYPSLFNIFYDM